MSLERFRMKTLADKLSEQEEKLAEKPAKKVEKLLKGKKKK